METSKFYYYLDNNINYISALKNSKFGDEGKPGYEANVIFLRHLVEKLFVAIEECDNSHTFTKSYLDQRTDQFMSRIYNRY